mgnify:CR=1 FL=1
MQYNEEKVPIKVHNFTVDSRFRDTNLYPKANQYVVNIPTPYRNVIKVELVNAVYEKYGTENYLNMHIDELEGNLESNNNQVAGIFTQLPLIHPLNVYNSGITDFRSVRLFERPIGKLGRLTISFRNFDDTPYPMQDHLLRFEIHCCKHAASIENRNLDLFSEFANVYVPASAPFASPATPMSSPVAPANFPTTVVPQALTRPRPPPPPFFYK